MGSAILTLAVLSAAVMAGEEPEAAAIEAEPAPANGDGSADGAAAEAVGWGAWIAPDDSSFRCSDDSAAPVSPEEVAAAETTEPLSRDQVRWLKPKLARMPANPRRQKSYNAFTLEPGEFEVGLITSAGLLSNLQVGTNVLMDGFGIYNGHIKLTAIEEGPLHVALIGSRYQLLQDRYTASFTGIGGVASLQILRPWGLHLGGDYYALKSSGLVDLDAISPYLSGPVDDAVDRVTAEGYGDLDIFASVVRVRAATDVRINRRDSIVLQFSAFVRASLQTELPDLDFIPDVANLQEALAYDGFVPIGETYMTSLAWQFDWKRAELRLGAGLSSVPGTWLVQSTEFSYKLGGETRRGEARMRRTWRHNKRDAEAWSSGAVADEGMGAPESFDQGPLDAPEADGGVDAAP